MFKAALHNALGGIRWGFIMAALLSAWLAFLALMTGSLTLRHRHGAEINVLVLMLVYFVGGAAAGAIVGAMRPLLRWKAGAVAVGVVASVPLLVAIGLSRGGFAAWDRLDTITVGMLAVAFGGAAGLIVRQFVLDAERRKSATQ